MIVQSKLLPYINKITVYDEFDYILSKMSTHNKGLFFEIFCEIYFTILPIYQLEYKTVYLYDKIPYDLKQKLKLPTRDKGIDGLIVTKLDEFIPFQVKYRKNKKKINFGELATFPALSFGSNSTEFKRGLIFTNCRDICDELKSDKYIQVTYYDLKKDCQKEFWENVRDYLTTNVIPDWQVFEPLTYQLPVLEKIKIHYDDHDYGRLYLACGFGKTFISYWTSIEILKNKKIFIVVPTLELLSQTYDLWARQLSVKNKFKFLLICSDMDKKDLCKYTLTTNKQSIKEKLSDNLIVIITYKSSLLLKEACQETKFAFDIGIYDEAHHTAGANKYASILLSYPTASKKRLFMTATEKIYNYNKKSLDNKFKEQLYSMDNIDIYGDIICRVSLQEAIEKGILCDYKIIAPFINVNNYDKLLENNNLVKFDDSQYEIRLIIIGIMIIDVIEQNNIKHPLLFSNNRTIARQIYDIITYLVKINNINIDCQYLSGSDSISKRKYGIDRFMNSENGLISSVRIFCEGIDIQVCDCSSFIDNKNSTNDIIQTACRCLRKCVDIPDKIGYIIVPFVVKDDNFFDNNNDSYRNLRSVLKSLGTTDELVSKKFNLQDCTSKTKKIFNKSDKKEYACNEFVSHDIDLIKFKQQIVSKIFDRDGEPNT